MILCFLNQANQFSLKPQKYWNILLEMWQTRVIKPSQKPKWLRQHRNNDSHSEIMKFVVVCLPPWSPYGSELSEEHKIKLQWPKYQTFGKAYDFHSKAYDNRSVIQTGTMPVKQTPLLSVGSLALNVYSFWVLAIDLFIGPAAFPLLTLKKFLQPNMKMVKTMLKN